MQTFALLSALAALAVAVPVSFPTGTLPFPTAFPTLDARSASGIFPSGSGVYPRDVSPSGTGVHARDIFPTSFPTSLPSGAPIRRDIFPTSFPTSLPSGFIKRDFSIPSTGFFPVPTGFVEAREHHHHVPSGSVYPTGYPLPTGEAIFPLPTGTVPFPTAPSASWHVLKPTGTGI